jgi:hypothetical protein
MFGAMGTGTATTLAACVTLAALWPGIARTQTTPLPDVTVTAPAYTEQRGGYLISGDFRVDPRMPSVVFPAQALVEDDILSVQPIHLDDDEYLVVQACASADCREARLVRVWDTNGATTPVRTSENRIWITRESKYFIWLKRLPVAFTNGACRACGSHFATFRNVSPPLTIIPVGTPAAWNREALQVAQAAPPVPVIAQEHQGSSFVVTFAGGSQVRIKRMHAAR